MPGVRELFEQEPPLPPRKTRAELMKDIDADYYGYRDDDDGILIPLEKKAEEVSRKKAIEDWKSGNDKQVSDESDEEQVDQNKTSQQPIPSQLDIQKALLERRKKDLLEQYGLSK